ncbi:2-dehydropantoate 2-reductase [Flavobacterium sp. CAU 1735]|uniref:ketopantoate reductase family protein n=1 Tax=Flavobacterium sp. CAU 1735 TaxID=3140361 RepID=UPI003261AE6C
MTTILIAGIGGVGGYFGGLLAKAFQNDTSVAVQFLARGKNLDAIRANGLTIVKGSDSSTVFPQKASDTPSDLDKADYIILCTKTYDLESTLVQLQDCITEKTVILPLLNGLDSTPKIKRHYPNVTVLEGCVYLVSRLSAPGIVTNSGNIESLFFGSDKASDECLLQLETLLKQAEIQASLTQDILSVVWKKFIFVSAIATATSFYDQSVGEILENPDKRDTLLALLTEVYTLAKAKHIPLPEDSVATTLANIETLPFAATSSLHSDFKNEKKQTELDALTGYVVSEGLIYGVAAPVYEKLYTALKAKKKPAL